MIAMTEIRVRDAFQEWPPRDGAEYFYQDAKVVGINPEYNGVYTVYSGGHVDNLDGSDLLIMTYPLDAEPERAASAPTPEDGR